MRTTLLKWIDLVGPVLMERLKEAMVRGVVWGFIGILFGSLFAALYQLALNWGGPLPPFTIAAIFASGAGALIYGSMRLAVVIAALCAPLGVATLIHDSGPVSPLLMVLRIALPGAIIGALYGLLARQSRVFRADAKALAGLTAGILIAVPWHFVTVHFGIEVPTPWAVALLCPTVGLLYTQLVEHFIPRLEELLPTTGDGALVGFAVAAYVGCGLWLVAGYIDHQILGPHASVANAILRELPSAMFGGMVGGFAGGFIGGAMGKEWQDL
jgi:hypothetical protein